MSLWSRAAAVAARTPESRNRLVDCLRAISILAVISGHWLLTAPYATEDGLALGNMLEISAMTTWLSWGFQVMPVFFLVGGYANGVSWRAALRDGKPFPVWLDSRLRRLLVPVLPLIALWALLTPAAQYLGLAPEMARMASQIAVIPVWFLAIYTVIILFVPLSHAAWQRFGFWSFSIPAALAVADDALFFAGFEVLGWLNYLFIWLAVHQLGYAWLDGRLARPAVRFAAGFIALALLYALTIHGPYPVAMISVPDAATSNTLPPKLPLLLLGLTQAGLLLSCEAPFRRWLGNPASWTFAVLMNGMIMTIYLWHSTAMLLTIAAAHALGNIGLGPEPATALWWLARPLWLLIYALVLAIMLPVVARFERLPNSNTTVPGWRMVGGAIGTCFGLAMLAYLGIGGSTPVSLQLVAIGLPFAGALFAGLIGARTAAPA